MATAITFTTPSGVNAKVSANTQPGFVRRSKGISPGFTYETSLNGMSASALMAAMQKIAGTGAKWLRLDYTFNSGTDGKVRTGATDAVIAAAKAAGIEVLILLNDANGGSGNSATNGFAGAWLTSAVTHLSQDLGVHFFEVQNEPNLGKNWTSGTADVTKYVATLKAAYPVIHAADPRATVLHAGLAPFGKPATGGAAVQGSNYNAFDFLTLMYAAGAQGFFDASNFHTYSFPALPNVDDGGFNTFFGLPNAYATMAANNDGGKKIWITEFGVPTGTDGGVAAGNVATPAVQAQVVQIAYQMIQDWPWAGPTFHYAWQDSTTDGDYGLFTAAGAAKPSFAAFSNIADIDNTSNVARVKAITSRQVKTANFTAAAGVTYGVDATAGAVAVTLPTSSNAADQIIVKKTDTSANLVSWTGKVDGVAGVTQSVRTQNQSKVFQGDGAGGWFIVGSDISVTALDGRYVASQGLVAPVVGGGVYRLEPSGSSGVSNGTDTGVNSRHQFLSAIPLRRFRLLFSNYGNGSTAHTGDVFPGANPITIRAAVEYPAGVYTPIYFGGSRDVVIQPGATATSDAVELVTPIPANTAAWARTFLSVTSGQTWLQGLSVDQSGIYTDAVTASAGETDKTMAAISGTTYTRPYGPQGLIMEDVPANTLRIFGIGDSISQGQGDTTNRRGWWHYAFTGKAVAQRAANPGERANDVVVNAQIAPRVSYLSTGANAWLVCYGTNDFSNYTLAVLQANMILLWRMGDSRGAKVWSPTLIPRTTSTDNWATAANQTKYATDNIRTAFNDWLRDGAPLTSTTSLTPVATGTVGALRAGTAGHPLTGYFEFADIVETARNSGLWVTTGTASVVTTDGTHPTNAYHQLIAAGVNLAAMRAAVGVTG